MAIYAVVESGTVTNMIEWDGVAEHPDSASWVLADADAYIGGAYDGSSFTPRAPGPADTYSVARAADPAAGGYPSIGDQLDMLWHAIDVGDWTAAKVKTTSFYTELKAVKDANPK